MITLFDKKKLLDLYPVQFGKAMPFPNDASGSRTRDFYLIIYITKGKGIFKNPEKSYTLSKGQAFIIRPKEPCEYISDSAEPWEYIWIGLSGEMARDFDYCEDVFTPDGNIFLEMMNLENYPDLAFEFLTGLSLKLYCNIFNNNKNVKSYNYSSNVDYANKVLSYIKSNYMNDIKISSIAKMLNLDRKYLARIFKKQTQMTMQGYITYKRLSEAKRLLEKGYNIVETARLTGYNDYIVFSKAFKKYYGFPPSQIRKSKTVTKLITTE